jgi:hypothetical protein
MKIPKYVIAPKGCRSYLTPGRRYEVHDFNPNDTYGGEIHIYNDNDDRIFCLLNECPHLGNANWIIPDGDADDDPKTTRPRVLAMGIGDIMACFDDNPHEIHISDGTGACILVYRSEVQALIEALKMMVAE